MKDSPKDVRQSSKLKRVSHSLSRMVEQVEAKTRILPEDSRKTAPASMEQPQQGKVSWILNFILVIVVAIPAIYVDWFLVNKCGDEVKNASSEALSDPYSIPNLCKMGLTQPILAVNVIFFFNVNILFYIISLIQNSTWLIDPYWTIIPVMITHFFTTHPFATGNPLRMTVVTGLMWIWSIRLTHSYFRRENWCMGAREDWRYAHMRQQFGYSWIIVQFFLVDILQQVMLVGLSLPVFPVTTINKPWNVIDSMATVSALVGITCAYFADTQLRNFMIENEKRVAKGQPKNLLLNSGIWYYSRHPNYFGENLWWWSLALFAINLEFNYYWFAGTLFNSLSFIGVVQLVESRMLQDKKRENLYREYISTTSVCIPFFKFKSKSKAQ